jgi:hypothetical protein
VSPGGAAVSGETSQSSEPEDAYESGEDGHEDDGYDEGGYESEEHEEDD